MYLQSMNVIDFYLKMHAVNIICEDSAIRISYSILSSLALKFYTYSVLASLIDIYIKIFSRLERDPKFSYGYMRGVSLNSYWPVYPSVSEALEKREFIYFWFYQNQNDARIDNMRCHRLMHKWG